MPVRRLDDGKYARTLSGVADDQHRLPSARTHEAFGRPQYRFELSSIRNECDGNLGPPGALGLIETNLEVACLRHLRRVHGGSVDAQQPPEERVEVAFRGRTRLCALVRRRHQFGELFGGAHAPTLGSRRRRWGPQLTATNPETG